MSLQEWWRYPSNKTCHFSTYNPASNKGRLRCCNQGSQEVLWIGPVLGCCSWQPVIMQHFQQQKVLYQLQKSTPFYQDEQHKGQPEGEPTSQGGHWHHERLSSQGLDWWKSHHQYCLHVECETVLACWVWVWGTKVCCPHQPRTHGVHYDSRRAPPLHSNSK